jgi:hypothetical protein
MNRLGARLPRLRGSDMAMVMPRLRGPDMTLVWRQSCGCDLALVWQQSCGCDMAELCGATGLISEKKAHNESEEQISWCLQRESFRSVSALVPPLLQLLLHSFVWCDALFSFEHSLGPLLTVSRVRK